VGRGEKLQPLPAASLSLVVVVPERRIATAQAYAALGRGASRSRRRTLTRATQRAVAAIKSGDPAALAAALHNDFEALEMVGILEAREAKAALLEAGCLGALLSGSGSAVFGIAPDLATAAEIAARLRARWPWVQVAPTVAAGEGALVTESLEDPVP
jgi:4-diphosphocytidyl-2-C-methyl-D-erythritol kinase